QGLETTLAQIAADELGLPLANIRVSFGDTDEVVYGSGTFASRSAVLCGGATFLASQEVATKLKRLVGHALEAAPEDVVLENGRGSVRGSPARFVDLAEVARWTYHNPQNLPEGETPILEATHTYDAPPGTGTFANSSMVAVVEVDPETGLVEVKRFVVAEDCGRMINPLIVDGQVHGGVAQGIGSALLEEFVYDEDGQMLTTTFLDYLLPGSTDVPLIEVHHLETPAPTILNGVKGMGEGGAIGPGAVIASAVEDALRPFTGAHLNELPLTPERLLRWMGRVGKAPAAAG
ncbi:MAG: molybdopterin-dependent oxidoreductase, partial [Acidimicrobiia bacterium]|nr:molybdopterin-dependent oxidoreductase [Acidimicrobiia bacterium]